MANTSTGRPGTDTRDDSATIAPENSKHVTAQARAAGATLKPGGAHGAPVDVGMTELHGEDVPSHVFDLVEHQNQRQPAPEDDAPKSNG
jgi:hypothetical protein